jgi:hypothetical protein
VVKGQFSIGRAREILVIRWTKKAPSRAFGCAVENSGIEKVERKILVPNN